MAQVMVTKKVDLCKSLRDVMSSLNSRHGVVGQNMPEIEDELRKQQIIFNSHELSDAANKLIRQGMVTIHFADDGTSSSKYDRYFVTLMSKV
jgi:hypothetical protein